MILGYPAAIFAIVSVDAEMILERTEKNTLA
jgi:hypothetical protein